MANLTVIHWRDIPAQVIAREGRKTAKRELSPRFQQAIDRAAMKTGMRDTDAYLSQWTRSEPKACEEDLETAAGTAAAAIEQEFSDERLRTLIANGGFNNPGGDQ